MLKLLITRVRLAVALVVVCGFGLTSANAGAETWSLHLTEQDNNGIFKVGLGDSVDVTLLEPRDTPARWEPQFELPSPSFVNRGDVMSMVSSFSSNWLMAVSARDLDRTVRSGPGDTSYRDPAPPAVYRQFRYIIPTAVAVDCEPRKILKLVHGQGTSQRVFQVQLKLKNRRP